ncbi:MAG: putative Ig domain-containing protein, partial [Candidatus Thermoplasmatota archaeon]
VATTRSIDQNKITVYHDNSTGLDYGIYVYDDILPSDGSLDYTETTRITNNNASWLSHCQDNTGIFFQQRFNNAGYTSRMNVTSTHDINFNSVYMYGESANLAGIYYVIFATPAFAPLDYNDNININNNTVYSNQVLDIGIASYHYFQGWYRRFTVTLLENLKYNTITALAGSGFGIRTIHNLGSNDVGSSMTFDATTTAERNTLSGWNEGMYFSSSLESYWPGDDISGNVQITGNNNTVREGTNGITVDSYVYTKRAGDVTLNINTAVNDNTLDNMQNIGIDLDTYSELGWDAYGNGSVVMNADLQRNTISDCGTGIYPCVYLDDQAAGIGVARINAWIEDSEIYGVDDSDGYSCWAGVYMDRWDLDTVLYMIIGNNTFHDSVYGVYLTNYSTAYLFNNFFRDHFNCGVYVDGQDSYSPWIIDANAEAVNNSDLVIRGDIQVINGGYLKITNWTDLFMFTIMDREYGIFVNTGGELYMEQSSVSSWWWYFYDFELHDTTTIDACDIQRAYEVYIDVDDVYITDSEIYNNFNGVHVDNASPSILRTEIYDNTMSGLWIEGADPTIELEFLDVHDNVWGIHIQGSSPMIVSSDVWNNQEGIRIEGMTADPKFVTIEIYQNNKGIAIYDAKPQIVTLYIHDNTDGIYAYQSMPIISGNYLVDNDVGVRIEDCTATRINDNAIYDGTYGIDVYDSTVTISHNFIKNMTWHGISLKNTTATTSYNDIGDWPWVNYSGCFASFFAIDSTVYSMNDNFENALSTGIILDNTMATFDNLYSGGNTNTDIYADGSNATFRNSTLASDYTVTAVFDAHITLLNTTSPEVAMVWDTSTFTVQWFLHVQVADEYGNGLAGATVNVTDATTTQIFSGLTGSDGFVRWIVCTEYVQAATAKTFYTPHGITATLGTVTRSTSTTMSVSKTVVIVINYSPVITSTPVTTAIEDSPYIYDVDATDQDGDTLTFSLTTFPTGMTINSTTGIITWTPTNDQVGDNTVVVLVSDGNGGTATQSFTITVANTNDAPTITSTAVVNATEDSAYTYDVEASDIDLGDVLTYSLSTYPAGMTIDSVTGLITWTPTNTQVGNNSVVVIVSDGNGGTATQSFTITVVNTNDAPTITSTPITTATEDSAYTYDVDGSDIDAGDTLTYSLTTAPSGMTIDSATGVITWTPTNAQVGDNTVVVLVSDGKGGTATQSFTVTVANTNDAPTITSAAVVNAAEDATYTYDVEASDIDLGDVLAYSLSTYPAGMTIDSVTGLITWTPTNAQVGNNSVVVIVSDGNGGTATQTFTITVVNTNDAPKLEDGFAANIGLDTYKYFFQVVYSDEDGDEPTRVYVIINGTEFAMTKVSGDDYRAGVVYELAMDMAPGEHVYQFGAEDADGLQTRLPPSSLTVKRIERGPDWGFIGLLLLLIIILILVLITLYFVLRNKRRLDELEGKEKTGEAPEKKEEPKIEETEEPSSP